jgi:hypothetical protein
MFRVFEGVTHTREMVVERILGKVAEMQQRHAAVAPEQYASDEVYSQLVRELLETKRAALSTLQWYLEDPVCVVAVICDETYHLITLHRSYLTFLSHALPAAGAPRREAASCPLQRCLPVALTAPPRAAAAAASRPGRLPRRPTTRRRQSMTHRQQGPTCCLSRRQHRPR